MAKKWRIIPIYTTSGDVGAYLVYPFIFNTLGEWVGWVTKKRHVYSVMGTYVGWLSDDPRILRKRGYDYSKPRLDPPPHPGRIQVPASVPLPPLMPEVTYSTVDVLEEEDYKLRPIDSHELKEDIE